jgi:hypothetical protein
MHNIFTLRSENYIVVVSMGNGTEITVPPQSSQSFSYCQLKGKHPLTIYDVDAKGFYTGFLIAQKGTVMVDIHTTPPFGTLDLDFSSPLALFLIRFQRRALIELTPLLGINTAGFDQGNSATSGYACVSTNQLAWIQQGQMNVVRMPVLPNRVLKALPDSTTVYNSNLFATAWTNGDNNTNMCNSSNPYYPLGTYMSSVMSALQQGLFVIIDLHDNANHLDTFGTTMTPDNFVAFWRLIATYINDNVDKTLQGNVFYELFNEPVGNKIGDWYTDYVVPTIKAIQLVSTVQHYILATTFGNYSGVHSWTDDGSLQQLTTALANGNITNLDHVWIAGHQYCDSNYSGVAEPGCTDDFNVAKYGPWISATNSVLDPYGFKWMLTEGNVRCADLNPCPNGNLWPPFLDYLLTQSNFLGFTVWMSNLGDDYGGTNMGAGPGSGKDAEFKIYSQADLYTASSTTNTYEFKTQFKGLL